MSKKAKYYIRPDGLHETTITINGKRKHFYGKTDREIDQKLLEYRHEVDNGRLFSEVAKEWWEQHEPTLAANTLRGYRPAYRRCVEVFGEKLIKQISSQEIKKYIAEFSRNMARKTVATQLMIFNLIFSYGVVEGCVEVNPCQYIKPPKGLQKKRREAASVEDEKIIKASSDIWLLPYLVLYTGLRKGEALALQYGDIDFDKNTISISKSVYHVDDVPHIKRPKTEAGLRTVPLLPPLEDKLSKKSKKQDFIFSEDGGKTPLREYAYQRLWEDFAKATGITCSAHRLRHSYATMLYECGIDVKEAQDLLGHSTVAMTQDIYSHLRDARKKEAAEKLSKFVLKS